MTFAECDVMESVEHKPPLKRALRWMDYAVPMLGLLVVYVLSMGPVVFAIALLPDSWQPGLQYAAEVAYSPIIWVCQQNENLSSAALWYLIWWENLAR
jgi:hypothetical protein